MTLRTELEKLVRIHGVEDVMIDLAYITKELLDNSLDEVEELTSKVRVLEDDLEAARTDATYWETAHDEMYEAANKAEKELHDIRNNFSTLIKTVYEEEGKLNEKA